MNKILVKHNTISASLIVKLFISFLLFMVFSSYILAEIEIVPEIRYNGRYRKYRQDYDGMAKIKFIIYDDVNNGNNLWESNEIKDIRVSSGIFSTTFSPKLTDKQWEKDLYLQIILDGKVLSPREKITYIPKSVYACNGVPTGAILIWSGSVSDIPYGWHLCDGSTVNGIKTPDLRDRFVLGAGNSYSVNATGGEKEVILNVNNIPAHKHGFNDYYFIGGNFSSYISGTEPAGGKYRGSSDTDERNDTLAYCTHNTDDVGGSQAHNNMPPYYSLCYIMRVK